MYNLRFPLISLHDYDNAFNEHILDFACSTYLGKSLIYHRLLTTINVRGYYFSSADSLLFRGYSLLFRGRSLLFRGYSLLFRGYSLLFRGCSVLFRGCSLLFRGYSLLFRGCSLLFRGCSLLSFLTKKTIEDKYLSSIVLLLLYEVDWVNKNLGDFQSWAHFLMAVMTINRPSISIITDKIPFNILKPAAAGFQYTFLIIQ